MRTIHLVGGALLLCLFLANFGPPSDAQVDRNTRWEYKAVLVASLVKEANVRDPDAMTVQLEKSLNGLGSQGWELCLEINGGVILKRPQ